jgi:hypothetical protein
MYLINERPYPTLLLRVGRYSVRGADDAPTAEHAHEPIKRSLLEQASFSERKSRA